MTTAGRDTISRALELMVAGLAPVVSKATAPLLPRGAVWTDLLEERDRSNGIRFQEHSPSDPPSVLRLLTERMGSLGFPLDTVIGRDGRQLASDLRDVRNTWAHYGEFDDHDVARAIETTERLLRLCGASSHADEVALLRADVAGATDGRDGSSSPSSAAIDVAITRIPTEMGRTDTPPAVSHGESPDITLELTAVPTLSYAAAHNRIPVISTITVHNRGDARRAAVLTLTAASATAHLSLPNEQLVDLAAGASVTLSNAPLLLDPAAVLTVEERTPASITATLTVDGGVAASTRVDVELLAAHQWVNRPLHLSLELLAAYVQPNDPVIGVLLGEASALLERSTGSANLEGYQSGPARVDQVAEAIFTAMQQREIRYSVPPASWGDDGQKIRTPAEVLDGRIGTCLDTTIVFAAALEQAGIRPLIFIVDGHSFVGYWREDGLSMGSAATTEAADSINYVGLGAIGVVETTLITDQTATFAQARRSPVATYLEGDVEKILGVTDVASARISRIFPLPARSVSPDGAVTVVEYHPAQFEADRADSTDQAASESHRSERTPVPYRVTQWKNALLDLSLRNRLINFTPRGSLSLAVPAPDVAEVENLVGGGKNLTLVPSDEVSAVDRQRGIRFGRELDETERGGMLRTRSSVFADVTGAAYTTRLRALAYKAKTIEEETGANNLYLAFGTLVWRSGDRELRSPLILVPVKLAPGRGGRYHVSLDESGASTPNYCLLEKLRSDFDLAIPGLADPLVDDSGIDLEAAFRSTREALLEAGLPFRIEGTVDLAILQFAKFRLWKDLDENWEQFAKNSLVRHLIETPTENFEDPADAGNTADAADLDELSALVPVSADSSQLAAVTAAIAGQTFVLEGPPGTGKSQTITNLLVRAVAEGKRVLFVAEKRAALEVVQRRLDEVGLGAFALDLHDKGSRPNAVRAQITQALQHRTSADWDGLSTATETLGASRRTLARYAERLHEQNEAGFSLYSARNRELAADPEAPAMVLPDSVVTRTPPTELAQLRTLFRTLPDVAEPARAREQHPWSFIDGPRADELSQDSILTTTAALDDDLAAIPVTLGDSSPLNSALLRADTSDDLQLLADVAGAPRFPLETIDAARTLVWKDDSAQAITSLTLLISGARSELAGVDPAFIDAPLEKIHADAVAADASSIFGRKKRRLAVREAIAPFLSADALPKPRDVSTLTERMLSFSKRALGARPAFARIAGLEQAPDWNPLLEADAGRLQSRSGWLTWLAERLDPVAPSRATAVIEAFRDYYVASDEDAALGARIAAARLSLDAVAAASVPASGNRHLTVDEPIVAWWLETAAGRDVRGDSRGAGRSGLARWIGLVAHVEPLRQHRLDEARRGILTGALDSDLALPAFEKGLAVTSLTERAAATTLDDFAATAHNRVVARFAESADTVREQLVTAIPAQLLERREFDPLATGGQVGELKRQLARQRGGLGVRALLERFGELITQLIPCVLMSPESVARFFAAESDLFDIVVFDEASQVRVADSIGAIGRARSVVVVGDSKQMPPTSFAEAGFSIDDYAVDRDSVGARSGVDDAAPSDPAASDPVLPDSAILIRDEESILSECVSARVPSRALTWHYRSQDEALISFSNAHYYGELSSFPSPLHGAADGSVDGHGITFVRVQGQFLRSGVGKNLRTNPVEAAAIVDEVARRFEASAAVSEETTASPGVLPSGEAATPSIGIITFNVQQRALIESMLRDSPNPRIVEAMDGGADGLFVKNLENVQGDERDTILFSTAFSANERGVLPLNFGPLSQTGGERRLNVAITRARRQVILYSSFDPKDLRAEESTSIGLRHLREYLEFAATGSAGQPLRAAQADAIDRHREEVAVALRERGYVVTTDVGLSDFRVDLSVATADEPDAPVAAVLLDSPAWAARRTVADRDGLPVQVLRNLMRWPTVVRVWMPEWLGDRQDALDRVVAAVESAVMGPAVAGSAVAGSAVAAPVAVPGKASLDTTTETRTVDTHTVDTHTHDTHTHDTPTISDNTPIHTTTARDRPTAPVPDFMPWQVRRAGDVDVLDSLPRQAARTTVAEVLREIVETEGPVHPVRLAKLAGGAFGLDRVVQGRMAAILACVPTDLVTDSDHFVWPAGLDPEWAGYRPTPAGVARPFEHVHPVEVVGGMVALCVAGAGLAEDELRRETLRIFGTTRMTAKMTELLDTALDRAVSTGRLRSSESGLWLASR